MTIPDERVSALNQRDLRRGDYVLYWMQQSQRAKWNHALEYAIARANELELPLIVCFGLTRYPEANARHYTFLLEGLAETADALRKRKIKFVLQLGDPAEVALRLGQRAALIVCDRGYLRPQKNWRHKVATEARCLVMQVESDVIVPVQIASSKSEFAARTLRPKLQKLRDCFLAPVKMVKLKRSSLALKLRSEDLRSPEKLMGTLKIDGSVPPVTQFFRGGTARPRKFSVASWITAYPITRRTGISRRRTTSRT